MRSQTDAWMVEDILAWMRTVAMPCVSLKSEVAIADATSATPKPYSAFLSASGIAESNTLPVSHGVSVPAMPTTTAMRQHPAHVRQQVARAELDHLADFEQRLGKRPVHRVGESRQRRRGLGRQTLRRHALRTGHDVRARPLGQQRHRILGRRDLTDHRPVIVRPPVVAQRHDARAVARRGRGDVHPFFEGQLVVARGRLAHLDAEHVAHQLARLEDRFCRASWPGTRAASRPPSAAPIRSRRSRPGTPRRGGAFFLRAAGTRRRSPAGP